MLHPNPNETESMEKAQKKRTTAGGRERDSQKKTVNEETVKKGPKIYDQNKICHT